MREIQIASELSKKKVDKILFGFGVNSYNRMQTFIVANDQGLFTDAEYWYGLRAAYEMSDNLFELKGVIKALFLSKKSGREYLMERKELKYLQLMDENITVYRGMTVQEANSGNFGISWSLKQPVAEFFAKEYTRNHSTNKLRKIVYSLNIHKKDITAFLNGREEFELIYIKKY